jgi:hypothetical protein
MTSRDVIARNLEARAEGRIGFTFSHGRRNDMLSVGQKHPPWEQKRWTEDGKEFYNDIWGNLWFRIQGMSQGGEVFKPVLEDWADLDRYELPDLANPALFEDVRRACSEEREKFRLGSLPGFPFAICRYMRKMEVYFADLVMERERIDALHGRVADLLEAVIVRYAEAGVDGVFFCEDLGVQDRTLMSPEMWRDIFRPLHERLCAAAHARGIKIIQHSCGYNWALVDDLCEAGINGLQFDQPAVYDQPALAKKLKGHGVGLWSPCDIQKVLPTGDRALIERETRRLVETFRGGFIAKNYPDLKGIGVASEWDQWAYEAFLRYGDQTA